MKQLPLAYRMSIASVTPHRASLTYSLVRYIYYLDAVHKLAYFNVNTQLHNYVTIQHYYISIFIDTILISRPIFSRSRPYSLTHSNFANYIFSIPGHMLHVLIKSYSCYHTHELGSIPIDIMKQQD